MTARVEAALGRLAFDDGDRDEAIAKAVDQVWEHYLQYVEDLDDLAKDTGNDLHSDGLPVTARLDAASQVARGKTARLWFDTSKVALFDAESGANLAPGDDD